MRLISSRSVRLALALGLAVSSSIAVHAAEPAVYSAKGAAIRGYDPVAYFEVGEPRSGDAGITYEWRGATWRFATTDHRDKFAADPERYAPQYGGYCAWAVSQGYTASIDPEAWTIVGGKLYLNYSKRVEAKWRKDTAGHIAAADANWPGVLD